MKVFISWSGEKSKAVSQALREWLPQVINAIEPWVSVEDMGKGRRWSPEIAAQLEASSAGIICLTASNLHSDWLLFESGALSKAVKDSHVCTFLIDIAPATVAGPLAQFQSTRPERDDVLRLLRTLNSALGDSRRTEEQLSKAFEKWWPDLKATIERLPSEREIVAPSRSVEEMTVEVLEAVRALSRQIAEAQARANFLSSNVRLRDISYFEQAELTRRVERIATRIAPDVKIFVLPTDDQHMQVNIEKGQASAVLRIPWSLPDDQLEAIVRKVLE